MLSFSKLGKYRLIKLQQEKQVNPGVSPKFSLKCLIPGVQKIGCAGFHLSLEFTTPLQYGLACAENVASEYVDPIR